MTVADVQRRIRQTRRIRVAAVAVAALNAVMLAVNFAGASLLALLWVTPSAVAVICCLALIVWQTRMIGTLRRRERELSRRERELSRPRMTPEDWRRLRELEIELGWEPSAVPTAPAEDAPMTDADTGEVIGTRPLSGTCACPPDACAPVGVRLYVFGSPPTRYCGACEERIREDEDTPAETAPGELGAPMTGPGGRWRPVSELAERDAQAAEHFAGLASVGRESCIDPCLFCVESGRQHSSSRDGARPLPDVMRSIDQWIEKGRWEQ